MATEPSVTVARQPLQPTLTVVQRPGAAVEIARQPVQPVLQVIPGPTGKFVEVVRPISGATLREVQAYIDDAIARLVPTTAEQFVQNSPAAVWTIPHGLRRYPNVILVDTAGDLFDADIRYVDLDTVVITLIAPTAGTAYLN